MPGWIIPSKGPKAPWANTKFLRFGPSPKTKSYQQHTQALNKYVIDEIKSLKKETHFWWYLTIIIIRWRQSEHLRIIYSTCIDQKKMGTHTLSGKVPGDLAVTQSINGMVV